MSEEKLSVRLSKIATEFNVGISTIVEDLAKKGHKIENNPNTRIPAELYDLLRKLYESDKKIKESVEKKSISSIKKEIPSTETRKIKEETSADTESESIIIKENVIRPPTPPSVKSTIVQPETGSTAFTEKPPIQETIPTTPELETEENSIRSTVQEIIPGPKIVGKIDLEKQKPSKKSTKTATPKVSGKKSPKLQTETPVIEEKKIEEVSTIKEEDEGPPPSLEGKTIQPPTLEQPAEIQTKAEIEEQAGVLESIQKDEPEVQRKIKTETEILEAQKTRQEVEKIPSSMVKVEPEITEPIPVKKIEPEEKTTKPDNFIPTKVKKLPGPTIIGKIELEQVKGGKLTGKEPVATSSEVVGKKSKKKKRKRISGESLLEKATTPKSQTPVETHKPVVHKARKRKDKSKDYRGVKEEVKPELTEEEIQKKVKETLSALKSQTSSTSKTAKIRRAKRAAQLEKNARRLEEEEEQKKVLRVTEFVTANELASLMNVPVNEVIKTCLDLGLFVSINQRIDAETISIIASEFGYEVAFSEEEILEDSEQRFEDRPEDYLPRHPIVTVMGHVDHGKTKLLDYIRNSNVIAGEYGGITQHIGAYEVTLSNGKKITFLDTPGHEAFTAMRARGAKITDIAIIVVAADDGVMPQTKEAINHALAAGVPLVFAINKMDKPTANPTRVKEELASLNILVEDWGGKYQCQEISAKTGQNVDLLLEKVLLEAELLDLKANPKRPAIGTVIESSLDKGRGYIAKILVQNGILHQDDIIVAGNVYGKIKAMYNERNQFVKEVGPSSPILILGLSGAPQAGDKFNVFLDDKEAKAVANKRQQLQREMEIRTQKHITLDEIGRRIAIGDFKELNLIVKGDVDGSVEALSDALLKLSTDEVQVNVIHKSVGQVTETDVLLASASNAIIVGFQVRPSANAKKLAEQEQIDIRIYSIIYQAIDEIKAAIEGMMAPKIEEKIVCNLEVKEIFNISKIGTVAGCLVLDGSINRHTKIRLIRDGIVIYTGRLGSLKRFKEDVKEVKTGQECGLNVEGFNDIKIGDIIEGFEEIEVKKSLK